MRRLRSIFSSNGLLNIDARTSSQSTEKTRLLATHADTNVNYETSDPLEGASLRSALLRGKKLRKIAVHLSNGSFDQALKTANSHLSSYPEDGAAWALIAHAHVGKGQNGSAADAFQRSALYDCKNIYLKRQVGLAEANVGEWEKAIPTLEEVLKYIGDDAVLLSLMRSYRETCRWDDAINLSRCIAESVNYTEERILSRLTSNEISNIQRVSISKVCHGKLEKAEAAAQQGYVEDAVEIFQEIIGQYPEFPDAWIQLSKYRFREGAREAACHLFQKGLKVCGADFYKAGVALSQFDADEQNFLIQTCYEGLEIGADDGKWISKFYVSHRNKVSDDVISIVERAFHVSPSEKSALLLMDFFSNKQMNSKVVDLYGEVKELISKIDDARLKKMNEIYYRATTALWGRSVERATAFLRDGDADRAIVLLKEVIEQDNRYIDSYFILGDAFFTLGNLEQAQAAFIRGLALWGDVPRHQKLVFIEEVSEAARDYIIDTIVNQESCGQAGYLWLADHYSRKHDWRMAEHFITKAIEIEPDDRSLGVKLVRVFANLGKDFEALHLSEKLVNQHPEDSAVHRVRGDVQMAFSKFKDAAASYKSAVDLDSSNPFYRARLAKACLINGEIIKGLTLGEYRKQVPSFIAANKVYPFPEWNGELLSGKRLLVWHEHGFGVGENILHSCFLNLISELGVDLVLEVEDRLAPLYRRSFPQADVVVAEQAAYLERSDIGYQTPIGSLARWFRTSITSFADYRPFFRPDVDKSSAARAKLQSETTGRYFVGISWTSNNPYVGDKKSIDLATLLNALDLPDVQLVNLQYGNHDEAIEEAIAQTGVSLIPSGVDNTNDLDGLAAVTNALDLVVSIGHTTAHLAGAIGKRNLVLLPSSPFVHWLATGSECIWYANSTLIRRAPGDADWSVALKEMRRLAVAFLGMSTVGSEARDRRDMHNLPQRDVRMTSVAMKNAIDGFTAQHAFGSVIELMQRKLASYGGTLDEKLQMTDLLMLSGRRAEAGRLLFELSEAEPTSADVVQRQYQLAVATYQLEDALRHSSVLMELREDTYELGIDRIALLHKLGRIPEALEASRSHSLLHGPSAKWALAHSKLLYQSGLTEQAEATLAPFRTITAQPEIDTALARYAYKNGKEREGAELLDCAATSTSPASAIARFWRARANAEVATQKKFQVPQMSGTYPLCSESETVIFFSGDNTYFWKFCRALIASICINNSNAIIHVHLVNPDNHVEEAIFAFGKNYFNSSISYTKEFIDISDMTDDMAKTYFACSRFIRLPELMQKSPATYLCIDCDCLVIDDISDLTANQPDFDIMAHRRFVPEEFLEVAAGGLVVMPTLAAKRFLARLYNTIVSVIEAGEASWFLDQIALNEVLNLEEEAGLNVSLLDISYIDWFFNSESKIWTGKGKRKSRDLLYLKQFNHYDDCASKIYAYQKLN
jgi:tetratricopeptide (TPR) repeat protein